jgi:SAM-dependent methyltransferase
MEASTRTAWDRSAKGWNDQRAQVRAWLQSVTGTMLDKANVSLGSRVLDVAAGAGDQTLDIAERVGAAGSVLATDLSANILAFAAENARRAGYANVETKVTDGEDLCLDCSFDAAVCRLGLMFFPDPLGGLRQIARALRPGGRACTLVFSTPQSNPCVEILLRVAVKHAGLPPRDPYQPGGLLSLGKPGHIDALFERAGFSGVTTSKVAAPMTLPSAHDYIAFIRTAAAPIFQLASHLDDAAIAAMWADAEHELRQFDTIEGWEGPNELLLAVGKK